MSLAGRIESFPLPDVLRLLARARKTGCLRAEEGGRGGRLYLEAGQVTYGSTREGDALGEDVVTAGLMERNAWLQVERRELSIADALEGSKTPSDLDHFVRELVTDVTFRMQRCTDGDFSFEEGLGAPYETGSRIDVEDVLAETRVRLSQWEDIEAVIPGVTFRLRMAPELTGRSDVTITGEAWRSLAALHGLGSISEVAERLGTNEFQVGKILAELVREGMVEVVDDVARGTYTYGDADVVDLPGERDPARDDGASEGLGPAVVTGPVEPRRSFRRRPGVGSLSGSDA